MTPMNGEPGVESTRNTDVAGHVCMPEEGRREERKSLLPHLR